MPHANSSTIRTRQRLAAGMIGGAAAVGAGMLITSSPPPVTVEVELTSVGVPLPMSPPAPFWYIGDGAAPKPNALLAAGAPVNYAAPCGLICNGAVGATGSKGASGASGAPGKSGDAGSAGAPGTNGKPGSQPS